MTSSDVTSSPRSKWVLRPPKASDIAFIYSTWLKNLYFGNSWFRSIERKVYFDKYKLVLDRVLQRSTVLVCCLTDDPDVVLGYVVYEPGILHWIYVKKGFRRLGIGKLLLPQDVEWITHLTKTGRDLRRPEWKFDPFV